MCRYKESSLKNINKQYYVSSISCYSECFSNNFISEEQLFKCNFINKAISLHSFSDLIYAVRQEEK